MPSDPNADRRKIDKLYVALLGRPADRTAIDHYTAKLQSGTAFERVFDEIICSPEFLNRNSVVDESTLALLSPEPESTHQVQIIFTTRGGINTLATAISKLATQLGSRDRITILDGSINDAIQHTLLGHDRINVYRFPGFDIFRLRTKIPVAAQDSQFWPETAFLPSFRVPCARWRAPLPSKAVSSSARCSKAGGGLQASRYARMIGAAASKSLAGNPFPFHLTSRPGASPNSGPVPSLRPSQSAPLLQPFHDASNLTPALCW